MKYEWVESQRTTPCKISLNQSGWCTLRATLPPPFQKHLVIAGWQQLKYMTDEMIITSKKSEIGTKGRNIVYVVYAKNAKN